MDDDDRRNSPWNVVRRVLAGKPAFLTIDTWKEKTGRLRDRATSILPSSERIEPPQPVNASPIPVAVNPLRDSRGNRIVPELLHQNCDDRIRDGQLELWLQFKNVSNVRLEICAVDMLGTKTQVCRVLRPNEVDKFLAYQGILPTSTSQCYAQVVYKELLSGIRDVFSIDYVLRFSPYHDTDHFTIHDLMSNGPPRHV